MMMVDVKRIWDRAAHNAFPGLVRYKHSWFCALREGQEHADDGGLLRIISSDDGDAWHSLAELKIENGDLRDPKLSVTPAGEMMLHSFIRYDKAMGLPTQSVSFFSHDGKRWEGPHKIGDPGVWLWRSVWHKGTAYGLGYGFEGGAFVRLYKSKDGRQFDVVVERLYEEGGPDEFDMAFLEDDTCLCLLRRDARKEGDVDNALLGSAKPPYLSWQWKDLGVKVGGPEMIALPDGRVVAALRKYQNPKQWEPQWTELCWVDAEKGRLETIMKLPSGGDCSYPGMVWYEGRLWVSYYSSHEDKTAIYLAKVEL